MPGLQRGETHIHAGSLRVGDVIRRVGKPSRMVTRVSPAGTKTNTVTAWFVHGEPEWFKVDVPLTVVRD